ncbi:MAG TPA: hypothetical protein VGO96_19645, partial [Pyrinomonadaceae bacterium]|nr:hypothetical protein [Pyrinomonadaceae bacterium]
DLEDLYRSVRDKLKLGKLDGFQKSHIQKIDNLINRNERSQVCPFAVGSLQYDFFRLQSYLHRIKQSLTDTAIRKDPLYLKAISVSFEFRDYLEELSVNDRTHLGILGTDFLQEFRRKDLKSKVSTPEGQELLKEKARLVSVYANQLRRQHSRKTNTDALNHETATKAVRSAIRVIEKLLQPENVPCHTVLGGLLYVESKLLRHQGQYKQSEEKLTKAIDYYTRWVAANSSEPNIQLASYKIAQFLGNIAWSKNSRGFCTDALALINAARRLIPPEWELDIAHLDLIYADVERALEKTDSTRFKEAISIVNDSYATFKNHRHRRMMSRSAFASALLNFYAGNLEEAELKLNEAEGFSKKTDDAKWLANCGTLRARILIKQKKAEDALTFLSRSIELAAHDKLTNQLVVAHIVKGEALSFLGNYGEALESFDKARKHNEERIGHGIEVSSERNKGWILLSVADTHLRNNDVMQAKTYLERWGQLSEVELEWLKEKADKIRKEVEERSSQHFIIDSNTDSLDLKKHTKQLRLWLTNRAKLQTGSEKKKDIAKALGVSDSWLRRLKNWDED